MKSNIHISSFPCIPLLLNANATGIKTSAKDEWAMLLPMNDGSTQSIHAMFIHKVASLMPNPQLRLLRDDIKTNNPEDGMLQELQVLK